MDTYRITFERVGRYGGSGGSPAPAPVEVTARDGDDLADKVRKHVRPMLGSKGMWVETDLDNGKGVIFCGDRVGGTFAIEGLEADRG